MTIENWYLIGVAVIATVLYFMIKKGEQHESK